MNGSIPRDFSPRRILVLQLRQIGDVLLATPAVRLLRQRFPEAAIDFLTEDKCAPMLEHNPDIDNLIRLDKREMGNPLAAVAWYWRAARQGYDLVVDFQRLPRCRFIVGFSRAAVRLSAESAWYNKLLYTHTAPVIDGYAAACKASVLRPLGIVWNGERPRLYLTDEERGRAAEFLARAGLEPGDTLVTLDPTHRRITRQWPAEHYGRLVDLALERRPDLRFVVLYGPGEEADARRVADTARRRDRIIVPDRVPGLRGAAALIERAALHFGNCSAPRHMAAALDTPSLAVLGSSGRGWTFPSPEHGDLALGLDCQFCERESCRLGTLECLAGLAPEAVLPVFLDRLPPAGRSGEGAASQAASG